MVESIALMNADIIPVYSSKDADILNYRKGSSPFMKQAIILFMPVTS
mgnify:FL=1